MVDLAGSEREVTTKDEAVHGVVHGRGGGAGGGGGSVDGRTLSQRLRETAQIKKALSNLGVIIKGLSRGDTPVGLPFRDSILTWLLKVCRGNELVVGRARCCCACGNGGVLLVKVLVGASTARVP